MTDVAAAGPLKAPDRVFKIAQLVRDERDLARRFRAARPFPHLVLEDTLAVGPEVMAQWPPPDWPSWRALGDSYQKDKRFCQDIGEIPEPFNRLIAELTGPAFLTALEKITGIDRLIPDPYLEGGGLHASGAGGVLVPHTDFHTYSRLGLYRRVNVLIYLNEGWTESDGAYLELGDPTSREVVGVRPGWGTCVIFETNDRSVHGFPTPVADGRWRRSIALYYYTAAEAPAFSGDATTYWRVHAPERGVRRARMAVYHALLAISRAFSVAAHLVNPNQGMKLARTRLGNMRAARTYDIDD